MKKTPFVNPLFKTWAPKYQPKRKISPKVIVPLRRRLPTSVKTTSIPYSFREYFWITQQASQNRVETPLTLEQKFTNTKLDVFKKKWAGLGQLFLKGLDLWDFGAMGDLYEGYEKDLGPLQQTLNEHLAAKKKYNRK